MGLCTVIAGRVPAIYVRTGEARVARTRRATGPAMSVGGDGRAARPPTPTVAPLRVRI
jgi:hypothetical protein